MSFAGGKVSSLLNPLLGQSCIGKQPTPHHGFPQGKFCIF
jgi:hypothetical protein